MLEIRPCDFQTAREPYYDSMDREIYLKQPAFTPKAFDPIPADIAQMLGVKPKEG